MIWPRVREGTGKGETKNVRMESTNAQCRAKAINFIGPLLLPPQVLPSLSKTLSVPQPLSQVIQCTRPQFHQVQYLPQLPE